MSDGLVYALYEGEYEDRVVVHIFANLERAKEWVRDDETKQGNPVPLWGYTEYVSPDGKLYRSWSCEGSIEIEEFEVMI